MLDEIMVNVGDLVYDSSQLAEGLGVVIGLEPYPEAARVLEDTNGEGGLRLGLAGGEPLVNVIGSIPLSELANALKNSSADIYSGLDHSLILSVLYEEASKGPVPIKK